MNQDRFRDELLSLSGGHQGVVLVKRAETSGPRLGGFASSFNPVTTAHGELIGQAASRFSLDEVLALAGTSNADKETYDCPLSVRLQMMEMAFADSRNISIGISSTAFFVDMVDLIAHAYPSPPSLYFIVGFDTFVRILDLDGRYLHRYKGAFRDPFSVLDYLLSASHLIVASRSGRGEGEIADVAARVPGLPADRILFLEFPRYLGERSSTEVRQRIQAGLGISGLVAPAVEAFIQANNLYSAC